VSVSDIRDILDLMAKSFQSDGMVTVSTSAGGLSVEGVNYGNKKSRVTVPWITTSEAVASFTFPISVRHMISAIGVVACDSESVRVAAGDRGTLIVSGGRITVAVFAREAK